MCWLGLAQNYEIQTFTNKNVMQCSFYENKTNFEVLPVSSHVDIISTLVGTRSKMIQMNNLT